MLLQLPVELIDKIAHELDQRNRLRLLLTCKQLHDPVQRLMYRDDVRHGGSYSLFWAAKHGFVETIKHARDLANAEVNITCDATKNLFANLSDDTDLFSERQTREVLDMDTPQKIDKEYTDYYADHHIDAVTPEHPRWRPLYDAYFTPLHLAAKFGNDEVVEYLLDHGADPHAHSFQMPGCQRSGDWMDPFQLFMHRRSRPGGHHNMDGGQVGRDEGGGITPRYYPLHMAICYRHESTARLLLSRSPSLQTSYCGNPERAEHAWFDAAKAGLLSLLRDIQRLHPDVDWIRKTHVTGKHALHFASNHCELPAATRDMIHWLVEQGAEVEQPFTQNVIFLHNEAGTVVHSRDADDTLHDYTVNPLLRACRAENLPAARALLDAGANMHVENEKSPLSCLLADCGRDLDDTPEESIRLLVSRGANVNELNPTEGVTFLHDIIDQWVSMDTVYNMWDLTEHCIPCTQAWNLLVELGARIDIRPTLFRPRDCPRNTVAEILLADMNDKDPGPFEVPQELLREGIETLCRFARPQTISQGHWQDILLHNLLFPAADARNLFFVRSTMRLGERLGYRLTGPALMNLVSNAMESDNAIVFYKLFGHGPSFESEAGAVGIHETLECARRFKKHSITSTLETGRLIIGSSYRSDVCLGDQDVMYRNNRLLS